MKPFPFLISAVGLSMFASAAPTDLKVAQTAADTFRLDWTSENFRGYTIEGSPDLVSWADFKQLLGNGAVRSQMITMDSPMPDKFFWRIREGAIRPGFDGRTMARGNNHTYPEIPGNPATLLQKVPLGFTINFYGRNHSAIYVNDNSVISFDNGYGAFLHDDLITMSDPMIASFFANTDTVNPASNQIRLSSAPSTVAPFNNADYVDGRKAFGVTYRDIGYFQEKAEKTNSFQTVIIDRSPQTPPVLGGEVTAAGDFDLEFNYDKIKWDSADDGLGQYGGLSDTWGTIPQAGFTNGVGAAYGRDTFLVEVEPERNAFRDTNLDASRNTAKGLIYQKLNNDFPGRLLFKFRNGRPLGANFSVSSPNVTLSATASTEVPILTTLTAQPGSDTGIEYEWADITSWEAYLPDVSFSDANTANPTVTLHSPGTYNLQLTAKRSMGGRVQAVYRTMKAVTHPGTLNVSTGADENNSSWNRDYYSNYGPTITVPLSGSGSSNMGTISYYWTVDESPIDPNTWEAGEAIFGNDESAATNVTFTKFGLYTLRLTATTPNGFSKYDVIYFDYNETTAR